MKRAIFTLMGVVLCAVAMAQGEDNTKTGIMLANEHKIVVEARRSAMIFDEIKVSRAVRVIVEERTTGNIIVRAPQSVMPYVSLSVRDNTLNVSLLAGVPVSRKSNIVAEVYVPYNGMINEITTSSAARVIVKPLLVCDKLDIEASSASVVEFSAKAHELSIEARGASNIKAEITATELEVESSGASELMLSGSVLNEAEIEVLGASTLRAERLNVMNLELECLGASTSYVKGDICEVKSAGASTVEVECATILSASAVGASTVLYSGNCQLTTVSNIGVSTIRKK